jgi:hypothetical protein
MDKLAVLKVLTRLALAYLGACAFSYEPSVAKDILVPQGQKKPIAFYKCIEWGTCHVDMCIKIKKADGNPGRAHLFSEWFPGRSHDLDVHEGEYCDPLDFYFIMSYTLYAVPDTDVIFTVGDEMNPSP